MDRRSPSRWRVDLSSVGHDSVCERIEQLRNGRKNKEQLLEHNQNRKRIVKKLARGCGSRSPGSAEIRLNHGGICVHLDRHDLAVGLHS